MAFHDVVFPISYSEGALVVPRFSTTNVDYGSGFVQSNQNWEDGLLRADVSHVLKDDAARDEILAFFRARKGGANRFKFLDWSDHSVGMTWVDNVNTHTSAHAFATGDGSTTVFQLKKIYTSGGYTDERPITRPKSAIRLYKDGTLVASGVSVDYATGLVTFTTAPANGVVIGWSGEFYVPVHFDSDELPLSMDSATASSVRLVIVEVREV